MSSKTRFICTIGPKVADRPSLERLTEGGMNIARINGSHGSIDAVRGLIRQLKAGLPKGVEILLDLPGNKIRTDNIAEPIALVAGGEFDLRPEQLTFRSLHARVKAGDRISAADGAILLDVTGVENGVIRTLVVVGGLLGNRKGLNIRGIHGTIPFDFERDIALLNLAIEERIDLVGLSFVRASEHVRRIKAQLTGTGIKVVAKVETAEAVERLDHILADADLIMVDRGDLEADIGRENVPLVTKRVLARARVKGVPAIVASQFLTTMLERPLPVMAEVSDIANAVLDGASILMLSEETAIGSFPFDAIQTLKTVARAAERDRNADVKVVILAAGSSTGFGSLTTNKHKCMLDVGGTTIVQHQLDNLRFAGIRDENIAVVTGHNHRQVEAYLKGEGFGGRFVFNPWYASTNMLVSLWLARCTTKHLVLYGDIIFDRMILGDLLLAEGPAVLAVDHDASLDPEAEKVQVKDGKVIRANKEIEPAQAAGEFIGLARFDDDAAASLFQEMDKVVREGGMGEFLTTAFERLAARGVPLHVSPTHRQPWNDNDTLADLDRSRDLVFPGILEQYKTRAGTRPTSGVIPSGGSS